MININVHISSQDRRYSLDEAPSDLVLDIQFEIMKLISEKEDLIKENAVLKHYRQTCLKLQKENLQLREKLELLEVVPRVIREKGNDLNSPTLSRRPPDGQEETNNTNVEGGDEFCIQIS